jgi:predicted nucleic acid-binding protein
MSSCLEGPTARNRGPARRAAADLASADSVSSRHEYSVRPSEESLGEGRPKDLLPFFRRTRLVRNKHHRCGRTPVGAAKSGSSILAGRVDQLLDAIEIRPLEPKADRNYGRIRSQLEKVGTVIGGNDLLIAAQSLAINFVLVTDNIREFKRVKELRVENWLRS